MSNLAQRYPTTTIIITIVKENRAEKKVSLADIILETFTKDTVIKNIWSNTDIRKSFLTFLSSFAELPSK